MKKRFCLLINCIAVASLAGADALSSEQEEKRFLMQKIYKK